MRLRRTTEDRAEATLNLTPTIDVVFLLLIFFVATMRFPKAETNIRAYLPRKTPVAEGTGEKKEEKEKENINTHRITLRRAPDAKAEIRLNGAIVRGGFSRLGRALLLLSRTAAQTPNVETEVVLDAERLVAYRHVVTTLDLCAKHGFSTVSFAMPPRSKTGQP